MMAYSVNGKCHRILRLLSDRGQLEEHFLKATISGEPPGRSWAIVYKVLKAMMIHGLVRLDKRNSIYTITQQGMDALVRLDAGEHVPTWHDEARSHSDPNIRVFATAA